MSQNKINHFVYFLYDQDKIVYIGRTKNLESRIKSHKLKGEIDFDRHDFFELSNLKDANDLEYSMINTHLPKHNKKTKKENIDPFNYGGAPIASIGGVKIDPNSYIAAEKAFKILCECLGFNRLEICNGSRKAHLVEKRKIIADVLHQKGFSSGMIGHVMNKDHTTILYYLNKLKGKKND